MMMIHLLAFKGEKEQNELSETFKLINTHMRLIEREEFSNVFDLPDIHHFLNANDRSIDGKDCIIARNQLLEKKLIVFIALMLLLGLDQRMHT